MKKQFYAAMAALMVGGIASAQTVSVIGLDGNAIATYDLDQVNQIVFTPGEDPGPQNPDVEVPEGWIGVELEYGLQYEGIFLGIDAEEVAEELDVPSLSTNYVEIYCLQNGELYGGGKEDQPFTAGGDGGFWFDKQGTVCNWGEGAAVYCEFYNDEEAFGVGQYPGTLEVGDVVQVTMVMIADENRVDFPLYFYVKAGETPDGAEVVYEESVSGSAPCINDYSGAEIAFNADAVAAALGLESATEARVVLQNPDGSFDTIPSAGNGFYLKADGSYGTWGDPTDSPWYIEYRTADNPSAFYAGEYGTEPNTSYTAIIGLWANDKIALITVTLNVGEDQRPAEEE